MIVAIVRNGIVENVIVVDVMTDIQGPVWVALFAGANLVPVPDGTPCGPGWTYDASGTQSKAVESGKPADYVNFSTGPDMTRLVPQFVDSGWDSGSTKGIVADSVVVIVVRKGNPKNIHGWNDLIKPGIQIVTPDPASSGSAKWNLLAAYEQVIAQGFGAEADAPLIDRAIQGLPSALSGRRAA